MPLYVIVVGSAVSGVEMIVGPFTSEEAADDFGRLQEVDDHYLHWGTVEVTPPEDEDEDWKAGDQT